MTSPRLLEKQSANQSTSTGGSFCAQPPQAVDYSFTHTRLDCSFRPSSHAVRPCAASHIGATAYTAGGLDPVQFTQSSVCDVEQLAQVPISSWRCAVRENVWIPKCPAAVNQSSRLVGNTTRIKRRAQSAFAIPRRIVPAEVVVTERRWFPQRCRAVKIGPRSNVPVRSDGGSGRFRSNSPNRSEGDSGSVRCTP
jgi:hypothetical protein